MFLPLRFWCSWRSKCTCALESVAVTEIQVCARLLCLVPGSRDYTAVRPDTDHSTLGNQRGHPFPDRRIGVAVWALQSSITTCRRYVPGIFSGRCDRLRAKRMLRREP